MTSAITATGLRKSFSGKIVLDGIGGEDTGSESGPAAATMSKVHAAGFTAVSRRFHGLE